MRELESDGHAIADQIMDCLTHSGQRVPSIPQTKCGDILCFSITRFFWRALEKSITIEINRIGYAHGALASSHITRDSLPTKKTLLY